VENVTSDAALFDCMILIILVVLHVTVIHIVAGNCVVCFYLCCFCNPNRDSWLNTLITNKQKIELKLTIKSEWSCTSTPPYTFMAAHEQFYLYFFQTTFESRSFHESVLSSSNHLLVVAGIKPDFI
jgi:hypothetical protein